MKLAFTIADAVHVLNAGGEVERRTVIVEIPDETLPKLLKTYLADKSNEPHPWCYMSLSISVVQEKGTK